MGERRSAVKEDDEKNAHSNLWQIVTRSARREMSISGRLHGHLNFGEDPNDCSWPTAGHRGSQLPNPVISFTSCVHSKRMAINRRPVTFASVFLVSIQVVFDRYD
jgi:hypothetical protein